MSTPSFYEQGQGTALLRALPEASTTARFLAELLDLGARAFVRNAVGERVFVAVVDGAAVPCVINDGSSASLYSTSPLAHYIRYGREELRKIAGSRLAASVRGLLCALDPVCRTLGFNRCVSINNWLLSTNPRAPLSEAALSRLTAELASRFPDHALVFRNVDGSDDARRAAFERSGYQLVVNRPVQWWHPDRFAALPHRMRRKVLSDIKCVHACGLAVRQGAEDDTVMWERIAALYQSLYIEKHSRLNASYTPEFFRAACRHGVVRLTRVYLRDDLVGFVTWQEGHGVIVPAVVGYSMRIDQHWVPIYRALLAGLFERSLATGQTLFLSTGATAFKRHRGGVGAVEHEAVYVRHLPALGRAPWHAIRTIYGLSARSIDTDQL